ncbi:hypothetical protein CASFOL_040229 [Castilleja foliolosa]|uniref:MULE transposase domain-containing protein n=1 Tax=Castilleja foliolosa TaxID=1961234 RepID=A0ABD3BEV5_9LAMI
MSTFYENQSVEGDEFIMSTPEFFTNQMFGSREELINWVKNMAYSIGVVVITKRSNKDPSGFVYKVVLMCDRGGKYKIKDSSRVSGTKKIDCPFELEGNYSSEYNSWTLTVNCEEHNHQPVLYMEGHPYAKRLSENEFNLVAELTRMNVAPRDILSILKDRNLTNMSTIRNIYNARNKIRMIEQSSNSPMQVLMSLLHSNGYAYEFSTTCSNELENLFFIVGVTSTNKTFSIAFVFMHNEKTDNYIWALKCLRLTLDKCMHPRVIITDSELALVNACKEVFSDAAQLLCRWHIGQNIFKHCRPSIKVARDWSIFLSLWKLLEDSTTLISYTENYKQLQSFLTEYPALDLILADLQRWKNRQVDSSNCGCQLRTSCGLPCACELSMHISSGRYISLDSIDIFWRKLDFSPSTFLMDILGPGATDIREPKVQKSTRGRPSLKKLQQKRRAEFCSTRYSCSTMPSIVGLDSVKEPARHSSYDINLSEEPTIDLNEVPREFEHSYNIDLNEVPPMNGSDLMVDIPKVFHPYITNIQNVKGDGNCGFRALAVCLGLDEEKSYEYIRQQMREELQNRYRIYSDIFVSDVDSLYRDLCFSGSPCPVEHWMKMPEAGVLIANKFGIIVHSLSMSGNTTIFPFWSAPEEFQCHKTLTIALVNDENHYVMVELQGEYPMPVITPYWNFRHITPSAARWETMYRSRLELYTQLCRRESCYVNLSD